MSRPQVADYARAGWYLVPIPSGKKSPLTKGWQTREACVTDPDIAEYLDGNIGLGHAYSGTCAFDIDDLAVATTWWHARGVDIQEFLGASDAVMLSSGRPNRAKLIYRLTKPLPSFKLGGFELRCSNRAGTTTQDVLPPSIHPDTGQPYEWMYNDEDIAHWTRLPELPEKVAKLWTSLITPDTKIQLPKVETPKNLKGARKTLFEHSPDVGYDDWVRIGMALHHESDGGSDGLDLWEEWSSKGTKFKGRSDLESHWRSFKLNMENPQTIGRLRIESAAVLDDFPIISDAEAKFIDTERQVQVIKPRIIPRNLSLGEVARMMACAGKSAQPLASLPNLDMIVSSNLVCGEEIRFDTFKDSLMVAPAGTDEWRTFADEDYTRMRLWLETVARFEDVPKEKVRDIVLKVSKENKMDSAQMWIGKLEWDGVPRMEKFFPDYMGTEDTAYTRAVGLYLWTAMAGRVLDPGCQVDMVPILVGKQGIGKSQGVRALAPAPEFYVEIRLDDNDDAIARKMRGTLVGELAELRGLRTADLDKIKAFVTRIEEKWVPKYVEFATSFQRRLVMIGTTNDREFLSDEENRRWLPMEITRVLVDKIIADRNQLWAEAAERFVAEDILWREAERLAKFNQDDYKSVDGWQEFAERWLAEHKPEKFKLIDIAGELGFTIRDFHPGHERRLGAVLRTLGYSKHNIRLDGKQSKVWKKDVDLPDIAC